MVAVCLGCGLLPGSVRAVVRYRYADDQPVSFPVASVIPGWSEILTRMPTGSTWHVVIPPELAYGEQGAGGVIEPNSTLVFEMRLISIG